MYEHLLINMPITEKEKLTAKLLRPRRTDMHGNLTTIAKQLLMHLWHTTKQQNNINTTEIQLSKDNISLTNHIEICLHSLTIKRPSSGHSEITRMLLHILLFTSLEVN